MEFILDSFVEFSLPSIISYLVQALEELGQEQCPPFSKGIYFLNLRKRFMTYSWAHRTIYADMCEPIFTLAARYDHFYIDENFAKFSVRRINSDYRTFSENLAMKWPGYIMSKSANILPETDLLVNVDDLLSLLRSSDLDRY